MAKTKAKGNNNALRKHVYGKFRRQLENAWAEVARVRAERLVIEAELVKANDAVLSAQAELLRVRTDLCIEECKVDNWVRDRDRKRSSQVRRLARLLKAQYGYDWEKVSWNEQQLRKLSWAKPRKGIEECE